VYVQRLLSSIECHHTAACFESFGIAYRLTSENHWRAQVVAAREAEAIYKACENTPDNDDSLLRCVHACCINPRVTVECADC
jgi:hypothetical protein